MNKEKITRKNLENFKGSPEEMAGLLSRIDNCQELLQHMPIENWIHEYISYGTSGHVADESKAYILYVLIFILHELKPIPDKKLCMYLNEPDLLLENLILIAKEEKDWPLDKHSALGLCSYIMVDYVFSKENLLVNQDSEHSALRQIIRNYANTVLDYIYDPVWELYFDQLLDLHNDDEDEVYEMHDTNALACLMRRRIILPDFYNTMQ